jgi:hypothetical protein
MFSQYLPKRKVTAVLLKLIAYFVIPVVFLEHFLIVYSLGAIIFPLCLDYYLDIDAWQVFVLNVYSCSFTFWNY